MIHNIAAAAVVIILSALFAVLIHQQEHGQAAATVLVAWICWRLWWQPGLRKRLDDERADRD